MLGGDLAVLLLPHHDVSFFSLPTPDQLPPSLAHHSQGMDQFPVPALAVVSPDVVHEQVLVCVPTIGQHGQIPRLSVPCFLTRNTLIAGNRRYWLVIGIFPQLHSPQSKVYLAHTHTDADHRHRRLARISDSHHSRLMLYDIASNHIGWAQKDGAPVAFRLDEDSPKSFFGSKPRDPEFHLL